MTKRLITFEGIDGSGKSTQISLLAQRLIASDCQVRTVREPGGTALSEEIRSLLLDHQKRAIHPRTETLLFSAARAQLVEDVISPALDAGEFVLCDRYSDSTLAYQGYGRELPLDEVATLQDFATGHLQPGLKILLDLPVQVASERLMGAYADRMETTGIAFQQRVREAYLMMVKDDPDGWLMIDGTLRPSKISQQVWRNVSQHYLEG